MHTPTHTHTHMHARTHMGGRIKVEGVNGKECMRELVNWPGILLGVKTERAREQTLGPPQELTPCDIKGFTSGLWCKRVPCLPSETKHTSCQQEQAREKTETCGPPTCMLRCYPPPSPSPAVFPDSAEKKDWGGEKESESNRERERKRVRKKGLVVSVCLSLPHRKAESGVEPARGVRPREREKEVKKCKKKKKKNAFCRLPVAQCFQASLLPAVACRCRAPLQRWQQSHFKSFS